MSMPVALQIKSSIYLTSIDCYVCELLICFLTPHTPQFPDETWSLLVPSSPQRVYVYVCVYSFGGADSGGDDFVGGLMYVLEKSIFLFIFLLLLLREEALTSTEKIIFAKLSLSYSHTRGNNNLESLMLAPFERRKDDAEREKRVTAAFLRRSFGGGEIARASSFRPAKEFQQEKLSSPMEREQTRPICFFPDKDNLHRLRPVLFVASFRIPDERERVSEFLHFLPLEHAKDKSRDESPYLSVTQYANVTTFSSLLKIRTPQKSTFLCSRFRSSSGVSFLSFMRQREFFMRGGSRTYRR